MSGDWPGTGFKNDGKMGALVRRPAGEAGADSGRVRLVRGSHRRPGNEDLVRVAREGNEEGQSSEKRKKCGDSVPMNC